jgi:hypothetical protein
MALSINRYLDFLKRIPDHGRYLYQALSDLQDAVNNLGVNVGADATKNLPAPDAPQNLTVKASNGLVHAVINDQNQLRRGTHYFVEYDTDPSFRQPHVVHLGASRTMHPLNLPALDDNGHPQKFYFRAYAQLPGGKPSKPVRFGGDTATAVDPGGTGQMTLLESTGSGTAPANGQSAGQGFGKQLHRPATVMIKPTS